MNALILAAGRGSRMGTMTDVQPKCLTQFQGKTLLDWQRSALSAAGITEQGIVCGYRKDCLPTDMHRFENRHWQTSNMVTSLRCADSWLSNSSCVVSYSDIVFSTDIVKKLSESQGDIAIAYDINWETLWRKRYADPRDDAETFKLKNNQLVEIGQKITDVSDVDGQYMGLLKFTPAGWLKVNGYLNSLPQSDVDNLDMTSLLQRLIELDITIETVENDSSWYEIDNINDLRACEPLPQVII